MTDLSKLTAKDFSDAMHKGWEGKGWNEGNFFSANMKKCCAFGAMAIALDVDPQELVKVLLFERGLGIGNINDNAGNKRAAMKAVDAILLGPKP